ncbi:methionyl-tRNA formyltransferase [Hoeflea marina]|uniref:Methionyl-tRNA formyltransferase n=1 Tax=Hoeflea marina TaxID=274592 RepID=A0A317PJJ6_9HYPH|nr:methionyl-tRNA formyltransferase [Hoeflea marina]
MRIIFMGTPDYAVATLEALIAAGHDIVAVYSQPPRPAGRRGLETIASPVHRAALAHGLAVFTPTSLKSEEEQACFRSHRADATVVVAYGLLLPQAVLDGARLGAWNGHASLLPRWRGAAPIQRAIMAGDTETGVMIMKMDRGLDTGAVALTETVAISDSVTAGELHDRLAAVTARLMTDAMARLADGNLPVTPQSDEGVTYAAKIDKAETRIVFGAPAPHVRNHIRGLTPVPGAWVEMPISGRPERVKVLEAGLVEAGGGSVAPGALLDDRLTVACLPGAVRLIRLQKPGGKPLSAADFLRGTPVAAGTVIG